MSMIIDRKAPVKDILKHSSNEGLLAKYAWYVTHLNDEYCQNTDDFKLIKAEILNRMESGLQSRDRMDAYNEVRDRIDAYTEALYDGRLDHIHDNDKDYFADRDEGDE